MQSQTERLRKHLRRHRRIDPMTALDRLGIYRLAARIRDLRASGLVIETERREGSQLAVYRLVDASRQ